MGTSHFSFEDAPCHDRGGVEGLDEQIEQTSRQNMQGDIDDMVPEWICPSPTYQFRAKLKHGTGRYIFPGGFIGVSGVGIQGRHKGFRLEIPDVQGIIVENVGPVVKMPGTVKGVGIRAQYE